MNPRTLAAFLPVTAACLALAATPAAAQDRSWNVAQVEYTPHSGCNLVLTKANSENRQLYITMRNAGAQARGFTVSGQLTSSDGRRSAGANARRLAPGRSIEFRMFHVYAGSLADSQLLLRVIQCII